MNTAASLSQLLLTSLMKNVVDLIDGWQIVPADSWVDRKREMWEAFCARTLCCNLVTYENPDTDDLYCHDCVAAGHGPYLPTESHSLIGLNPNRSKICAACLEPLTIISTVKCHLCVTEFFMYMEGERLSRYVDGRLKAELQS